MDEGLFAEHKRHFEGGLRSVLFNPLIPNSNEKTAAMIETLYLFLTHIYLVLFDFPDELFPDLLKATREGSVQAMEDFEDNYIKKRG